MFPYGAVPGKRHPRKLCEYSCGWRACFLFNHRQGWVLTTFIVVGSSTWFHPHCVYLCVRITSGAQEVPCPHLPASLVGSEAIIPTPPLTYGSRQVHTI